MLRVRSSVRIWCAECGREAREDAAGWKAEIGVDLETDHEEVVLFCPSSHEREFGERG